MTQSRTVVALSMCATGLLAAASVQAQTNVTVYGRANATFENTKVEGQPSKNQVVDNNSRIGFRGSEDLGSGLSAIFQYEAGVTIDGSRAGGPFNNRDMWVGLKSNAVGTVKLGYMTSPLYYATHDYISMHNHDTGNSSDALLWVPAFDPERFRLRNGVSYATPSFGGFMVEAQWAALREGPSDGSSNPAVRREHHWSITPTFDSGPLHVGLGYAETKKFFGPDSKDSMFAIAGLYDFKVVVVGALYERDKSTDGGFRAQTGRGGSHTRNYWRLAVMAPVGAHEFHANYGRANDWSGTGDTGGKQWTLGYNYNLSKRTKVYAFWTEVDNDKVSSVGGGGAYGFLGSAPGLDNRSVALGLRHNF